MKKNESVITPITLRREILSGNTGNSESLWGCGYKLGNNPPSISPRGEMEGDIFSTEMTARYPVYPVQKIFWKLQQHLHHQHQAKAEYKCPGNFNRFFAFQRFGNDFEQHHKDHRAGGKSHQNRHQWLE